MKILHPYQQYLIERKKFEDDCSEAYQRSNDAYCKWQEERQKWLEFRCLLLDYDDRHKLLDASIRSSSE